MEIVKPIFIVGSGRSGTSLLYHMLAPHPELGWFSNLSSKFPHVSQLPLLHRVVDWPIIADLAKPKIARRDKYVLKPSEAGKIYRDVCGFVSDKQLTEKDKTPEIERKFKQIVKDHLRYSGKPRFLSKQTANCQHVRLIADLFPDAYFVHLVRDGRAVANSLSRVWWWNEIDIWWLGDKPPGWAAIGKDPIALCALHWKTDVEQILDNQQLFGDRYIEIRYEDLVTNTREKICEVLEFCQLNPDGKYLDYLPQGSDMNYKWRSQLTERQQKTIEQNAGELLSRLGYI